MFWYLLGGTVVLSYLTYFLKRRKENPFKMVEEIKPFEIPLNPPPLSPELCTPMIIVTELDNYFLKKEL
jgi:hypothetical protein